MKKGEVFIRARGGVQVLKDVRFSGLLRKAFSLYKRQRVLEGELREMKLRLLRMSGGHVEGQTALSLKTSGAALSILVRRESFVPEENVKRLKAVLGRDFLRLVKVQKRYLINGGPLPKKAERLVEVKDLAPRFRWADK